MGERILSLNEIPSWGFHDYEDEGNRNKDLDSIFPIHLELNKRLHIWQGNITQLKVDVIVNSNNETLSERTDVSGLIHDAAGHELEHICREIGSCPTGNAVLTTSGKIKTGLKGAKYIIHTVPPQWKEGAEKDLESKLEKCFENVFQIIIKENENKKANEKIKTIAFCVLRTKNYPRESAANTTCRKLRHLLEKHSFITNVVIAFRQVDVYDKMIFDVMFAHYFPRNSSELENSRKYFNSHPRLAEKARRRDHVEGGNGEIDEEENEEEDAESKNANVPILFSSPLLTHDESLSQLISTAHQVNLDEFAGLEFIFKAGEDPKGRSVVVLIEAHLPDKKQFLDKVLMYMIKVLDTVAPHDYVFIYISRLNSSQYFPDLNWFKKSYSLLEKRYNPNLKQIYIIHPTLLMKTSINLFLISYAKDGINDKIIYLNSLKEIYRFIPEGTIYLPDSKPIKRYLSNSPLTQTVPSSSSSVPNVPNGGNGGNKTDHMKSKNGNPPTQAEINLMATLGRAKNDLKQLEEKLNMANEKHEILTNEFLQKGKDFSVIYKEREAEFREFENEIDSLKKEISRLTEKAKLENQIKDSANVAKFILEQSESRLREAKTERSKVLYELSEIGQQADEVIYLNNIVYDQIYQEVESIRVGKIGIIGKLVTYEIETEKKKIEIELLKEQLSGFDTKTIDMKNESKKQFVEIEDSIKKIKKQASLAIAEAEEAKTKILQHAVRALTDAKGDCHDLQESVDDLMKDNKEFLHITKQLLDKLKHAHRVALKKMTYVDISHINKILNESQQAFSKARQEEPINMELNETVMEAKALLRREIGLLTEKMVTSEGKEKEKYQKAIRGYEAVLAVRAKAEELHVDVMDINPMTIDVDDGLALLDLQKKTFGMIRFMYLVATSPLQYGFLQWRSFVTIVACEEQVETLKRKEQQLRREKAKVGTEIQELEDEEESEKAEKEHLKKRTKKFNSILSEQNAKLEELGNLLKSERTSHLVKMEELASRADDEKEKLLEENEKLKAELAAAKKSVQK